MIHRILEMGEESLAKKSDQRERGREGEREGGREVERERQSGSLKHRNDSET